MKNIQQKEVVSSEWRDRNKSDNFYALIGRQLLILVASLNYIPVIKNMFLHKLPQKAFFTILFLFFISNIFAQKTWDGGGDGINWGSPNNWNPNGVPVASETVTISRNGGLTINLNGNYSCSSLTINYTWNTNGTIAINFQGANTLAVTNTVNLNNNATNWGSNIILNVSNGTLSCSGINFSQSGNNGSDCSLDIQNGTVNCTGDITMGPSAARNDITFTGTGIINIDGDFSSNGTFNQGTGTVNYNGAGAQNVATFTYYNLTMSGGGDKSLPGAITVSNNLNLTSGNLLLGNNNLTLSGTLTGGSSSSMVVTDGTGYLIRNANAALPIVFPVGTDGLYDPLSITAINNTFGTISVRTTAYSGLGPKYVARYWDIFTSAAGKIISATIQYDASEITMAPTNISFKPGAGVWQVPVGTQSFGANSFSITGTSDISTVNSSWTAGAVGTYYSYQTGDWDNPTTWTSDPGGTTQVGSTIPGGNDAVVILNGRTVSLPADVTSASLNVTINSGGILDMSTYQFTAGLASLSGEGTLKLASVNFPVATINTFVDAGGGTTEYNNTSDFNLPAAQTTYNNLTINASGITATQLNNITLNGNLHVKQGTYRINDNTAARRQLTIFENVTVDNGSFITIGTGVTNSTTNPLGIGGGTAPFINYYDAQSHRVVIYGDFTNNGIVRFTNLNYPVYNAFPPTVVGATTGMATVYFRGATNNTLTCNGTTNFYNLVLDKGIDQTFSLTVYSSAYPNFRLFGANIAGGDGGGNNPNLKKALWIRTGTLVLRGLSIIPSLSEGTCAAEPPLTVDPNSDFYIPANGALILDGADVVVLSTADDYREVNVAYGVAAPSNAAVGIGLSGCSSFSIYGKIQINNGYFSTRESGGFITWDVASGQFELNGGQVDAKQFRAAGGASGLASFTQTGGTLYLRGRFQRTPTQYTSVNDLKDFSAATLNTNRIAAALNGNNGTLNLNAPENVFIMSGGTLRIYDVCGTGGGQNGAFEVFSSTANINVTGGTVEIIPTTGSGTDATTYLVESNAPVNNFIVNRVSGTSPVQLITYPLYVLKNITLQSGVFNANNLDVTIGGNFTILGGTTYTTGTNRTIFSGNGNQVMTVNLATPLTLNKVIINKEATDILSLSGTQNTVNITDSLKLITGRLNDNGKIINCAATIYNSGIHYGTGRIVANGTILQFISGNGTGVFENLEINNTNAAPAPVSLTANATVNGQLTFSQNKLFNIGTFGLTLGSSASVINGGTNRYIQTSGNAGDGGLTKIYAAPTAFNFPVGVVNYTPGSVGFSSAPTAYGSITVVPVNYSHPNVTTPGRSLSYFWRVKSSGFTLGAAIVTHGYTYAQANVVTGGDVTEDEYVAARYNSSTYTWTKGTVNDVDETVNIIGEPGAGNFLQNVTFIDGDYTAGDDNPTDPFGIPTIFYSRQTGLWSDLNNWSLTGHTVDNPPATPPGASDIVIIGDNDSIYLATNLTVPNTGVQNCASLQIESGSALDIGYNPGCNFSMVINHTNGNGNFRLTTTTTSGTTYGFPSGDFSDYNVNGGTTEFYTRNPTPGAYFILPPNVTSYGNLILSAFQGSNVILPNNNYTTIYGDLTCNGSDADAWLAVTWNGAYGAILPKTVHIKGNLNVNRGSFVFIYNAANAQTVIVDSNVIVAPGAGLYSWTNSSANTIEIGGSLINNSDNSVAPFGTVSQVNLRYGGTTCNLVFFGPSNASITNTVSTPTTVLNRVRVNKGSSQSTTLTVDVGGTLNTLTNNWLTLQNGTLIYDRTGNFTITTTSTFTIPSTSGLYINTPSNVLIANANSNTNDLYLNGKLTLMSGNIYIGPTAAPNYNNDIEYSGGGFSEIDVQGGNLIINGQVRRNPATTSGVLKYNQTGGQVVINGNNSLASNAKLEILNAGSVFNMSGGSLYIVRGGGGNTYGDLYIRPQNSTVTGGEIIFSQVSPLWTYNAVQNYILDATVSLNNLTITGKNFGTNRDATVTLLISPIVLNGTLTLTNNRSIFDANTSFNISVTIKGNLDNSGTYNYYQNLTTFSGGIQSILGSSASNFYDLTVNPVTSLTLNGNTTVDNDLTLSNGTLICGANTVYVAGDVANNATYTDTSTGIVLDGTDKQYISGTGTFGQLELNNSAGARLNNSITLQKNLILTQGIFDINKYMLTLLLNSNILGAPFSSSKMIISDGVFSNVGITKFFGVIGAPVTFTYPMGTSGKYTPAVLSINSNTNVGSIRLNNINSHHPGVIDPANVLDYYWEIESNGIMGFNGNFVLNYLDENVMGTQENNYLAARLIIPGTSWSLTSDVDDIANTITFNYVNTDNLSGEYTAGINTAFPPNVPEYTSNTDGNWTNNTIWTQTGGTFYPCPVGGPNGFIVIVDHEVTVDNSYCSAYRLTINNKLKVVSPFFGHNFGTVDGGGTLYLESGTFPAGRYTDFLDCSNTSTMEYGGTGSYTLIADLYSSIPNLLFSGTGSRILPNNDLTICDRLIIGTPTDGPTLNNSVNNRELTILGTIERYNTGAFTSGTGSGATVSFAGSSAQTIGGSLGDFTGTNAFNNFEINNAAGLTINAGGAIEVKGYLLLTNGLINTSATNTLTITNSAINCVTPAGGSASSYVSGPLIKLINQSDNFLFPIGQGSDIGNKITLSATLTGPTLWTAEYFNPNTYTTFQPPLTYVNTQEYWSVTTPAGNQAIVNLKWDPLSDLTPLMTQNGLSDMRVAEHNGADWIEVASTASGNNYYGSVQSIGQVAFPVTGNNVTLACINVTKPKATLSPTGPVCGAAGIPVTFSQSPALNYTLSYSIDGIPQTPVTVVAVPYTLPTPSAGVYQLTGFTYNNGANVGVVDVNTVTTYDLPTTADAGTDQSLCGASSTTLAGNPPVTGSGLWSIISGTGGTVVTPTSPTSDFNGTNGTTYTLRWTISNGSCTSSDDVIIDFPLLPLQPGAFIISSPSVCQGQSDVVYAVPNDPTVTYNWNYSGSGATINGSGNSISIDFDLTATSGTLSVTATNGCGTSAPRNLAITVNPLPTPSIIGNADVCETETNTYSTAATGNTFVWTVTGGTIDSGQGTDQITVTWDTLLPLGTLSAAGTVEVEETNPVSSCQATSLLNITIHRVPETGPVNHIDQGLYP